MKAAAFNLNLERNEDLVQELVHLTKQRTPRTRSSSRAHVYHMQVACVTFKIDSNMHSSMSRVHAVSLKANPEADVTFYVDCLNDSLEKMREQYKVIEKHSARIMEIGTDEEKREALLALEGASELLKKARSYKT